MLYVIDASALSSVNLVSLDPNDVFSELTDLVGNGELCFSNQTVKTLERLWNGSIAHLWAKTAFGSLADHLRGGMYADQRWVMSRVPNALDADGDATVDAVAVLAHGKCLMDAGIIFTVVTEDFGDKPTKTSIGNACVELGFNALRVRDFLTDIGCGATLN